MTQATTRDSPMVLADVRRLARQVRVIAFAMRDLPGSRTEAELMDALGIGVDNVVVAAQEASL